MISLPNSSIVSKLYYGLIYVLILSTLAVIATYYVKNPVLSLWSGRDLGGGDGSGIGWRGRRLGAHCLTWIVRCGGGGRERFCQSFL